MCHVQGPISVASDVENTFLIDLLTVKKGHGIMCFDAVAAFGQAPKTELIFIEAPKDHRPVVGQHVVAMFESERRWTQRSKILARSFH